MAPKKAPSSKAVASPASSHRGGKGGDSQRGAKSGKKKATKKKAASGGALDSLAEEEALESMPELIAPVQAIVDRLRLQLEVAQKTIDENGGNDEPDASGSQKDGPPVVARTDTFVKKRTNALRVWKSFAAQRLAEMASSLDAALVSRMPFQTHTAGHTSACGAPLMPCGLRPSQPRRRPMTPSSATSSTT